MTAPWLIGCEYSGVVSGAFREAGIPAYSCDLLPTEGDPAWHIQADIVAVMKMRWWRGIVLHVPCTALGVCGNKHYGIGKPKHGERWQAVTWTLNVVHTALRQAEVVALENPASVIFPILRDDLGADVQYVQPWQHGHPEQKKTGLALWGLPRLVETNNVHEEMMKLPRKERERIFYMSPSADRGKERARFYPGIAKAMAAQWGLPATCNQCSWHLPFHEEECPNDRRAA